MKRYRTFTVIGLMAALLLSACSQDELAENNTTLPEGEYPLQIGSVTLTAEVSEQPWTRVAESTDGMSSVWKDRDKIGVRIGDNEETGIYVMNVDAEGRVVGVTPEKPVYWKDKQPATITAWYPLNEELDFTHQNQGLTYLLKATGNGDYQSTPINLNFIHQLAKVRVKLEGTKADEVTAVTVRSYPTSTHSHGTLDSQDRSLTPQYVSMREATYDGVKYWEANLRPGTLQANNSFEVAKAEGAPVRVTLDADVPITAGQVHTINISVNPVVPEDAEVITDATGEISGEGDYVVRGSFGSSITITGGSPDIYLDNANIDLSRNYQIINPISITNGASPIIHVVGNNSITACDYTNVRMAGIYVDSQSSVTICGNGTDDVLTVTGGSDGAAIGGYSSDYTTDYACGDIAISNVTVYAYVVYSCVNKYPPAIGSTGDATCGSITITDAIVHAHSHGINDYSAPAIGAYSYVPEITISGSEIYAYRGTTGNASYADYIGQGGKSSGYQGGQIQGTIKNTTVHKYLYQMMDYISTPEGVVEFDENGIGTEQSQ
ncbi:MAG TPA: fimbrillin family protein [Candidatus Cryptobacteroides pullicola]|nr:fimbrillin family protein [Candidatus Cryptobacteroides pullicola]